MNLPASLVDDLKKRRVLLFAGAGLSAILGLPNWAGLIVKMAKDLGFDPELFERLGTYPSLAEYYLSQKPDRAVLARWLTQQWHNGAIDISTSSAHAAMVDTNFPIIYTTNYDHWIETAHEARGRAYSRIIHGEEISDANAAQVQIVKFHGDLEHPDTMVLTEADYFERLRFEAELDLKLRYDLLRYSIIFVGYSLADVNMRNMLYRLSLFRKQQETRRNSLPRSYIFLDRQNPVQAEIFRSWGIDTINSDTLDRGEALEEFMRAVASA
jgi:SIR2-like domain